MIRPFKEKPRLSDNYEDEAWSKLQLAIDAIVSKQPTDFGREELYGMVENICIHKKGARLYQRLHVECERHVAAHLEQLQLRSRCMGNDEAFLAVVERAWADFCNMVLTIRSIFLYLDRSYVIHTPGLRSIWDSGLDIFREHLRRCDAVEDKITSTLLATVARERHGEHVNQTLLRSILRMLSALEVGSARWERTGMLIFLQ